MSMIRDNVLQIRDNISLICKKLGRNPNEITIVGVTKQSSVSLIKDGLDAGITHIGENRVQEALRKYQSSEIKEFHPIKHLIGHLQTNKVKEALGIFDVIQSIDSLRLAQEIEKQCSKSNQKVTIFIQVNTSGESQKFGISNDEAFSLIQEVSDLKNITVCGLMTIAPWTDDRDIVRDCFKRLKELNDKIIGSFCGHDQIQMKFLSMGMSDDYEIALEEGSNMVRIGRAIFS